MNRKGDLHDPVGTKQTTITPPPEKQSEVLAFMVFLKARSRESVQDTYEEERGKRIIASFQLLAELKTFAGIDDPVQ